MYTSLFKILQYSAKEAIMMKTGSMLKKKNNVCLILVYFEYSSYTGTVYPNRMQCKVTNYFKMSWLQYNYTCKYWVIFLLTTCTYYIL